MHFIIKLGFVYIYIYIINNNIPITKLYNWVLKNKFLKYYCRIYREKKLIFGGVYN